MSRAGGKAPIVARKETAPSVGAIGVRANIFKASPIVRSTAPKVAPLPTHFSTAVPEIRGLVGLQTSFIGLKSKLFEIFLKQSIISTYLINNKA